MAQEPLEHRSGGMTRRLFVTSSALLAASGVARALAEEQADDAEIGRAHV